jgi:hypothetical protein
VNLSRNYDPGPEALPLTIADGDVEGKPALRIQRTTHLYEQNSEGLPNAKTLLERYSADLAGTYDI